MYLNIPEELRLLPQFVAWDLQQVEGTDKPSKIPYDPKFQRKASVSNSDTWGTFEQACEAAKYLTGIGIVLTKNDPYAVIDLDYTEDVALQAKQAKIAEAFNSYSEISPSGKGLHIVVKGSIPCGRRKGPIEMYSTGRYMTFTGNVYKNLPIVDCQELLMMLWEDLGEEQKEPVNVIEKDETQTDYEILKAASEAVNGQKFIDLYEGNWQIYYPSQSEADHSLINIIAYYTQNKNQITRIFRASQLGKRAKALRHDYCNKMICRAFDNQPQPINFDNLRNNLNLQLSKKEEVKEEPKAKPVQLKQDKSVKSIEVPPGLIGEIAKFIYACAPRPVPEIAVTGALGLMSGIVGRCYNISGTGLNQYLLLLAGTGCHAKGTEILMYDGSIKLVEDVKVNDKLMGPDSTPRTVLNLARGNEQMVRITPVKGESFIVNINHILHLYKTKTTPYDVNYEINISIKDYFKQSNHFKHLHKLVRTEVVFPHHWTKLSIEPWFLGVMLGDGHFVDTPTITSSDEEIFEKCDKYVKHLGLKIRESVIQGNKAKQHSFCVDRGFLNPLTIKLKKLNLWQKRSGDKFIPNIYKTASKNERLNILAGILDADGHLSCNGYDYISKSEQLAKDVVFIARSLGLAAYINKCEKYSQLKTGGFYFRVSITGNTEIIPCILKHKQAKPRQQIKNHLVTGFKVELLENDDFYGFALDKDHLYLTSDFTIHHNTGKEAISSGIDKLMKHVVKTVPAAMEFIGPSAIASEQALIKYMSKTSPSFASVVGEFGLVLKNLCSQRANSNQIGLRKAFLELYNKSGSGNIYKPIIYSDREKNTTCVNAPAFSIIGESTPERFYETLTDEMIYEGLLPRFTMIEYYGNRPQLNENHIYAQPSNYLVEQLSQICAYALQLNNGNNTLPVNMDSNALQLMNDFNNECDKALNHASNEIVKHLWSRNHVKALKLAALLAVGVNYINPVITEAEALWAIQLIKNDTINLLSKYETGNIGAVSVQNEQVKDVYKAIKKYLTEDWIKVEKYPGASYNTHFNKVIPYSFLTSYCRNRVSFKSDKLSPLNAIKTIINSLCESGELQEINLSDKQKQNLPKNGKIYAVTNSSLII